MLASHVDDLIWACHPKYQYIIDDLKHFQCGKVEQKKFRYCGKEVAQDDDFTIHVTMRRLDKEAQEDRHSKGTKVM